MLVQPCVYAYDVGMGTEDLGRGTEESATQMERVREAGRAEPPGGSRSERSNVEPPALIKHAIGRVHELFAAHAVARPDAVAVSGSDETLTYGQLEQRANQLAHRLRAL